MKFLGLLAMASAAAALPVLDNLLAGKTKELPVLSEFGKKKSNVIAKGHGTARGTGNFLPGVTEIESLGIPKRDAPVLSELTVGVQGGEVVKREAKSIPLDPGSKGFHGGKMVKSLPLKTLTGILKRWVGMEEGEEKNVIEKRQGKMPKKIGKKVKKGRKGRKGKKTSQGGGALAMGADSLGSGKSYVGTGKGALGQLDKMKGDDGSGGVELLGAPVPIGKEK